MNVRLLNNTSIEKLDVQYNANKSKLTISKKDRLSVLKWQIVSLLGLNLSYILIVAKEFSYMGFSFDFSLIKLIVSTFILFFSLSFGYRIKKPFFYAVWNIIFIYYLGGEIIYYQYNTCANVIQVFAAFICLMFIYFFSKINIRFKQIRFIKKPDLLIGLFSILLLIPFLSFYPYINYKNLLFIDVYETRNVLGNIGGTFFGYVHPILSRILLPFLIIKKIEKKQYKAMIFYIMALIYLYLCGALKSTFIVLIAIIIFYKGGYSKKILLFLKGISFLTYIGIILYLLFNKLFLVDSFIRRVFFVPPSLGRIYYDFFKNNYTYLSHSPLGLGIVTYPYDRGITMYIGEVVLGQPGLNANIGLFTEGIISFGFIGGILGALIVSLIILFFAMVNIDPKYFGIIFVYIYYMNTSLLSTLLLTHGLFFLMMFSFVFLRSKSGT